MFIWWSLILGTTVLRGRAIVRWLGHNVLTLMDEVRAFTICLREFLPFEFSTIWELNQKVPSMKQRTIKPSITQSEASLIFNCPASRTTASCTLQLFINHPAWDSLFQHLEGSITSTPLEAVDSCCERCWWGKALRGRRAKASCIGLTSSRESQ